MSEESTEVGTEQVVEKQENHEPTKSKPSAKDSFVREADKIRDVLGIVDGQAILTLIE
jgi:hypothetical protein